MIGTTNVISKKNGVEKVNVILKTNQASHGDLVGVAFTVTYGTYTKSYTWNGNALTIEIPAHVEYTITFSGVSGYATPAVLTYTAVSGNARTVNAIYRTEVVLVTVNADNGESMAGQVVTINGTQYTWNGTAITQKIPFGTAYTVSVNDKEDYVTPQRQSFTANRANRNVNLQYTEIPVIDLSKVNIYGNPVMQNTANCYVIKEAGKYKFPIAYGAAIKNGEANPTAYTNNGGANSHDFVNYLGNVITSPYVETDTATQAASVQISIADMDNAVTNLEIVDGEGCRYVAFEVPEVPAVGANAVISVKDSSGVIMWSWHLWLWEDDLAVEEITNATNVTYKILPYNLGSKWDGDNKTYIKNWFYQFGRPTPLLCPSAYNSTSNHASYGVLSYASADKADNIQASIQNPAKFYYNSSAPYNWFGSASYYNLWDAGCTDTVNSDNDVKKTVYDPCPPGFKMPNGNTFTYFSTSNVVGSFAYGWKFKRYSGDTVGVFFPASGCRNYSNGSLRRVGSSGYGWLSSAGSQSSACSLDFGSVDVSPHSLYRRAYGFGVRPVQDVDLALPTHKLTINVSGATSGYEVKVYSVTKSTDETTGEVTETLGNVLAIQTTASATHELVWGTEYKIAAGDVESYITPESQSYTADVEYRSVNLEYVYHAGILNPTNGVWIQDVDGYFHTEAEWDGNYTPNGVAVITDSCQFTIALEDIGQYAWGGMNVVVENCDYSISNGELSTAAIIEELNNVNDGYVTGAPAAEACREYIFPNGKVGYLGSGIEWSAAVDNRISIKSALTKCGGNAFATGAYWTSSQYGKDASYVASIDEAFVYMSSKSYTNHVRAFCSI